MKNIIIVLTLMVSSLCVLAGSPPAVVLRAFETKFPKATDIHWEKETPKEYEAHFKWEGKSYSANFDLAGKWMETERTLAITELPKAVLATFDAAYKRAIIKATSVIETPDGKTNYEIEIHQGSKIVEILYDESGKRQ